MMVLKKGISIGCLSSDEKLIEFSGATFTDWFLKIKILNEYLFYLTVTARQINYWGAHITKADDRNVV